MSGERMHIQHPWRKAEMLCGLTTAAAGPQIHYGARGYTVDADTPIDKPKWCKRCRREVMQYVPLSALHLQLPAVIPVETPA